jgi:hypothetical protein
MQRENFSTQVVVCRNSKGQIIKILTQFRPSYSPVYGEALAAQLAGVLAINGTLSSFSASSLWEAKKINSNVNFCTHYMA